MKIVGSIFELYEHFNHLIGKPMHKVFDYLWTPFGSHLDIQSFCMGVKPSSLTKIKKINYKEIFISTSINQIIIILEKGLSNLESILLIF